MTATYHAAMMDAATGGSQNYDFEADADLFLKPADDIVHTFICALEGYGENVAPPLSYELNSALKKLDKQVVMATGSIHSGHGDIPFLLMISPAAGREGRQ